MNATSFRRTSSVRPDRPVDTMDVWWSDTWIFDVSYTFLDVQIVVHADVKVKAMSGQLTNKIAVDVGPDTTVQAFIDLSSLFSV